MRIIRVKFQPPMYDGPAWTGNVYKADGTPILSDHWFRSRGHAFSDLEGAAMLSMMYDNEKTS